MKYSPLIAIGVLSIALIASAISNSQLNDIVIRQNAAIENLEKADATLKQATDKLEQACLPLINQHR